MAVVLYRDANYEGPAARLGPGIHTSSGCDLHPETCSFQGKGRATSYTENLDNKVSSLRVPAGIVVALYGGYSETSPGDSRTFVGPADIPDLTLYGFDDKTSAARVARYDPHGAAGGQVTLYSQAYGRGTQMKLGQGDYDETRLASDESSVIFEPKSACAAPGVLAVLYEGPNFDPDRPSILLGGGSQKLCAEDLLSVIGPSGLVVRSVRVLAGIGALPPASAPEPARPALPWARPGRRRPAGPRWSSAPEPGAAVAPAPPSEPGAAPATKNEPGLVIVRVPAVVPGLTRVLLVLLFLLVLVLGFTAARLRPTASPPAPAAAQP